MDQSVEDQVVSMVLQASSDEENETVKQIKEILNRLHGAERDKLLVMVCIKAIYLEQQMMEVQRGLSDLVDNVMSEDGEANHGTVNDRIKDIEEGVASIQGLLRARGF